MQVLKVFLRLSLEKLTIVVLVVPSLPLHPHTWGCAPWHRVGQCGVTGTRFAPGMGQVTTRSGGRPL
jgi:hypothetical protein